MAGCLALAAGFWLECFEGGLSGAVVGGCVHQLDTIECNTCACRMVLGHARLDGAFF